MTSILCCTFFSVKCKETINHETCQEIKTFDFSQLLHTPSKTRKKRDCDYYADHTVENLNFLLKKWNE